VIDWSKMPPPPPLAAPPPRLEPGAVIVGPWRYLLIRQVQAGGQGVLVVAMLNPSTAKGTGANKDDDDATIRRLIALALRLGYRWLVVVNLFAFRTAYPAELFAQPGARRNGPDADKYIGWAFHIADRIVCGWGANVDDDVESGKRIDSLVARARAARKDLWCLGRTKSGQPRHPVRLANATPLELWRSA
jgi:hypothetical protein